MALEADEAVAVSVETVAAVEAASAADGKNQHYLLLLHYFSNFIQKQKYKNLVQMLCFVFLVLLNMHFNAALGFC